MPEITTSKKASPKAFTVVDEVVHLEDLTVNKKTGTLGKDTFDKRISFSKKTPTEVDSSVMIFAGEVKEGKVVCTAKGIKPGYVVYTAGLEHEHAFPENIKPFPVIVHTKKNGELVFSVVPKDKTEDVMKSHETMREDIRRHGIETDEEGFYDLKGVRKLLELFEKSFSPDRRVKEQGIDLTKWKLDISDPKEATKRMRLTLEVVSQDQHGISKAVKSAENAYEFARNPEVMKLIPDPLPHFHEAGKIR